MRRDIRKKEEGPIPMTEEGLRLLREELARLQRALPELAEETARTAAYGDRSDNAEYKDAKARLRRTNFRIIEIQNELKMVEIIRPGAAAGAIRLGSLVDLESEGIRFTFQIVGPRETNPTKGRISHVSPLGQLLLGRKEGEVVTLATEAGLRAYQIIQVR